MRLRRFMPAVLLASFLEAELLEMEKGGAFGPTGAWAGGGGGLFCQVRGCFGCRGRLVLSPPAPTRPHPPPPALTPQTRALTQAPS